MMTRATPAEHPCFARHLEISKQRVSAILRRVPAAELEAALAAGAGRVRCPHCGKWVRPHEAGGPHRAPSDI